MSVSEAKALLPLAVSTSDSWRCHPDGKKFGSPGQHMNVASSPRRRQIAKTAVRNMIIASTAISPVNGLRVNSIWPGPHSSSIDRGGRPMSLQAVAQGADGALDAVEPGFGEKLVALLEDLDGRWRRRRAGLVQADAIAGQANDVVLHLAPSGVRAPGPGESLKLPAHDGAPIQWHRSAVAEVHITEHLTGAICPGQD